MNFIDLLNGTVSHIIKGNKRSDDKPIICFLKEEGWPSNLNKNVIIEYLQNISNEKIESDPGEELLDLLTSTKRSAAKISLEQKDRLRNIIKAIQSSHTADCKHKTLGVAIFMHGGGFTPMFPLPELICTSCGLNITVTHELTLENCGLKVSPAHIDELGDWASKCFTSREDHQRFSPVEDMVRNPIKAYEESCFKFPNKIKVRIVDYSKVWLASGT